MWMKKGRKKITNPKKIWTEIPRDKELEKDIPECIWEYLLNMVNAESFLELNEATQDFDSTMRYLVTEKEMEQATENYLRDAYMWLWTTADERFPEDDD